MVDQRPHRLGVLQAGLQLRQLLLSVTDGAHPGHLLQGLDVTGQRQDVQVVVQEDAGVVGSQTEYKSLIEPVHHVLVSLCPEPAMEYFY